MKERIEKPKWQTAIESMARANRRRQQRREEHEPKQYRLDAVMSDGTPYSEAVYRPSDDPAFQYEAGFEEQSLLMAIDALTAKQRKVIILHYFNELTFTEIGNMMGISKQCSRRLCIRAEATLKKNITNIL